MSSSFGRDIRTAPNLLSLSRIVLVLASALLFSTGRQGLGIAVGVVGAVTDMFDGALARATGQVTRLGEILDQFGDLCFEATMLLVAVVQGFLPAPVLVLYLFREFWVSGIRRFMAGEGLNIPSSPWGKLKTNLIMWGLLPTFLAIMRWPASAVPVLATAGRVMIGLGLLASYVSGLGYTRAFMAGYGRPGAKSG
jgi:CDP-diacylglycerol--glycerol-3-phosphate 3-phosphatidyltransferase